MAESVRRGRLGLLHGRRAPLSTLRPPLVSRLAKQTQPSPFKSDLPGSKGAAAPLAAEESLILDARGELSPAQMVERKLMSLLRGRGSLASHIQMAGLLKGRG